VKTGVVLLAGGRGTRFGLKKPKQLSPFLGRPLILHPLKTFLSHSTVKDVVLVVPRNDVKSYQKLLQRYGYARRVRLVEGGAYRGESVRNGFFYLSSAVDVVLIHDGARPLISRDVIGRVERAAYRAGVALAAWPLADTLKQATHKDFVRKTIPRAGLWLAQTPQGFRRSVALRCLLEPDPAATDDVELAQRKGFKVALVKGNANNLKVTVPADLKMCEALVKTFKT
jgi:2-C-methyl-D-erythritol 4-phosphate cytidylyltransferase